MSSNTCSTIYNLNKRVYSDSRRFIPVKARTVSHFHVCSTSTWKISDTTALISHSFIKTRSNIQLTDKSTSRAGEST